MEDRDEARVGKGWRLRGMVWKCVRLRCGNMEENNKYWLNENKRFCVSCKEEEDNIEHFVRVCKTTRETDL